MSGQMHTSIERIDGDLEARLEEGTQCLEVEDVAHQLEVVLHGVDHLDGERAATGHGELLLAQLRDVADERLAEGILPDRLADFEDAIGELLERGPAIRAVELDAE